jgi:hypothetical protein
VTTAEAIRDRLCATFCKDVAVQQRSAGIAVSLPIVGRDGDHLTAYVNEATGGWRISDMGATLMRLSYENDLAKLLSGSRNRLYKTVLKESGLDEDDGELYIEVPAAELTRGLFALGQGVTRIEDLGLWTRSRVESTFQDDLRGVVIEAAGTDRVIENYEVPGIPSAENYLVDFCVRTHREPLYIFGVQNRDRARLATIILQHLNQHKQRFNSMIVYADIEEIPSVDQRRLMLSANDAIPSIVERETIIAKIGHRLAE